MAKHLIDTPTSTNATPTDPGEPPLNPIEDTATRPGSPNWIILVVIGAFALAIAAGAALAIAGSGDDSPDNMTGDGRVPLDAAVATVDGEPLIPFEDLPDDAVGQPAPTVSGTGLDGEDVAAPVSGRPTLLVFLAHWCPHCQVELPVASDWLAATDLPDEVDVVAVASAIDPNRPNYPASDWFRENGWEAPVLGDADSNAATDYGLVALPYWVVVDADGNVVERRAGEQTPADFDAMVNAALGE